MIHKLPLGLKVAVVALVGIAALLLGWFYKHQKQSFGMEMLPAPPSADRYALASLPAATVQRLKAVRMVDVAGKAGLTYHWTIPGKRPLNILQTIGNGCAFLDYNNDGSLDLLLVGTDHLALYKGDGHGHFSDVSQSVGLDKLRGHFLGCAVGDYDNDGFDDLYISGYRTGILLHNNGGRSFTDATQKMGLRPQPWGTSSAWGDLDGDGFLDLYVCNYVDFGPHQPQLCRINLPDGRQVQAGCEPGAYRSLKGVLYHNLGGRRFVDVTHAWGADTATGPGLGVAFGNFDDSGHTGFAVANDEKPGDLFQNDGSEHLHNIGRVSGTAFDTDGHVHGGMGLDWGDYDNDGNLDLMVCTYEGQVKNLYHNLGNGLFEDQSHTLGIHHVLRPYVSFGCKLFDADNSGWLDLLVTNGHTFDNIADILPGRHYRQPTELLYNIGGKRFVAASDSAGLGQLPAIVGRGLAVGDFDNDGRMDALVVNSEGAPLLLHNESSPVGHWLELKLEGTKSNRDGYGAMVTVGGGGLTQTRLCHADGSYLSSSDRRVHVGLGSASEADQITIRWPSGHMDVFRNVPADQIVNVREGSPFIKFAH